MKTDIRANTSQVLDETDRAVVQALQLDGRLPFRRIAEVLGVSDQTVARRYARLHGDGLLRVLGLTDPLRLGETLWLVKVVCAPDTAAAVGEALARRPDTAWVQVTSGGTEITCSVRSSGPVQGDVQLLRQLPRTPKVLDVAAYCVLHVFFGRERGPLARNGPLTERQIAALTPPPGPAPLREPGSHYPLEDGDRRMLDVLARDGRAGFGELAAAAGWSQTTVRRRVAELRAAGVLYFDLDHHRGLIDAGLHAAMWLEVDPARLQEAGEVLAGHREVSFAAATTGSSNVYAALSVRDAGALYRYLTGPVAALPGLRRTATAPLHRALKGPGPYRRPVPAREPAEHPAGGHLLPPLAGGA